MVGMLCINFLTDEIAQTRTDLSCSDVDNITDGTKLFCLLIDLTAPMWILGVISVIGGIVIYKLT